MKITLHLDKALGDQLEEATTMIGEKPATVLRLALRSGLPLVAGRFQAPAPEGYFADAYKAGDERIAFEDKMAKGTRQRPER